MTAADPTSEHCFYCLNIGLIRPKSLVIHDARLCVPCCPEHADWRKTTSHLVGHGENCHDRLVIRVKS